MKQDEIIEMARQVRVDEIKVGGILAGLHFHPKDLMDFAKLVAAKEREACAKVCEDGLNIATSLQALDDMEFWGEKFAKAIRERDNA